MAELFWFLLLLIMVFLSAFFSGSEIAIFSLTPLRIRRMAKQGIPEALELEKIRKNPGRMIITILVGNTIVNIAASSIATWLALDYYGDVGVGISAGLMTLVLLTFGEIVPKTLGIHNSEEFARRSVGALRFFGFVLSPIVLLFEVVPRALVGEKGMAKPLITEKEIRAMIDLGVDEKAIEAAESQMLNKMLDFSDTPVSRVMIPMRNVIVFDSGTAVKAAKEIAVGHGFSRYPVRNAATGEIIGVVHIKYLDRLIREGKGDAPLGDVVLREVSLLITAEEKLDVLFRKMQREHIHMAVVVDEPGKQVGVVTFEDLVEAIFGPIADEEEARRGKALK